MVKNISSQEPIKYCSASHQISSDGKTCKRKQINRSDMCRYARNTAIAAVALIGIGLLFKLLLPGAFAFATHSISHILCPFGNNDIANYLFGGAACVITAVLLTAYLFRNKKLDDYLPDLLERLKKKDVQPLKNQSSAELKKIADKMTSLVQDSSNLYGKQFRMYAIGNKIELRFFNKDGIPYLDESQYEKIQLTDEAGNHKRTLQIENNSQDIKLTKIG